MVTPPIPGTYPFNYKKQNIKERMDAIRFTEIGSHSWTTEVSGLYYLEVVGSEGGKNEDISSLYSKKANMETGGKSTMFAILPAGMRQHIVNGCSGNTLYKFSKRVTETIQGEDGEEPTAITTYQEVEEYGYNGGGQGGSYFNNEETKKYYGSNGYGGGGATHIALESGLLDELIEDGKESSLLLVAGGSGGMSGGGAYKTSTSKNYKLELGCIGVGGSGGVWRLDSECHADGYAGSSREPGKSEYDWIDCDNGGSSENADSTLSRDGIDGTSNSPVSINGKSCYVNSNGRGGGGGGFFPGRGCAEANECHGGGGGSSYGNPKYAYLYQAVGDVNEYTFSQKMSENLIQQFDRARSYSHGIYRKIGRTIIGLVEPIQPSKIVLEKDTVELESSFNISITDIHRLLYTVTHEIEFSIPGYDEGTVVEILDSGVNEYTFSVPESWAHGIPSSLSSKANCTLRTYISGYEDGGRLYLGEETVSFEVVVPDNDKYYPVCTYKHTYLPNGISEKWVNDHGDIHLTGITGLKFDIAATPGLGSEIESYTVYADGDFDKAVVSQSGIVTIDPITSSSSSYTIQVKDKRGRGAGVFGDIDGHFFEYTPPSIGDVSLRRCLSDGKDEDLGTYCKINANVLHSPCIVSGRYQLNTCRIYVYYRKFGIDMPTDIPFDDYVDTSWTFAGEILSGEDCILPSAEGAEEFSTDTAYDIKVVAVDNATVKEKTYMLDTSLYLIHFKAGGRGVGFGTPATREKAVILDTEWGLWRNDVEVFAKLLDLEERMKQIPLPHSRYNIVLTANDWVALADGGYSQTVEIEGIRADMFGHVDMDTSHAVTSRLGYELSASWDLVGKVITGDGFITAICWGSHPVSDLPISIEISNT